jgi:hypothetical protein
MSTGRAIYPVPPQCGQSVGSTDPPQLHEFFIKSLAPRHKFNLVTKREQPRPDRCVELLIGMGSKIGGRANPVICLCQ